MKNLKRSLAVIGSLSMLSLLTSCNGDGDNANNTKMQLKKDVQSHLSDDNTGEEFKVTFTKDLNAQGDDNKGPKITFTSDSKDEKDAIAFLPSSFEKNTALYSAKFCTENVTTNCIKKDSKYKISIEGKDVVATDGDTMADKYEQKEFASYTPATEIIALGINPKENTQVKISDQPLNVTMNFNLPVKQSFITDNVKMYMVKTLEDKAINIKIDPANACGYSEADFVYQCTFSVDKDQQHAGKYIVNLTNGIVSDEVSDIKLSNGYNLPFELTDAN